MTFLKLVLLRPMLGERNHNLGLYVVNMGSLCFYMREESRFLGGFVGVCTKSVPF